MATKTLVSKQFSLKWRDGLRGLIMAIGTPMIYLLQEMIPGYNLDPFLQAGISAGLTYIIKNFIEPAKVITTTSTNTEAKEVQKEINKVV